MDKLSLFKWTLNFFELLACVTGFVYWNKLKKHWRWFPVYLAVIVLLELTGKYLLLIAENVPLNIAIYKYFGLPVQFLFFYWLIWCEAQSATEKKWVVAGAILYTFCWLADIIFLSNIKFWFSSFSYTAGNVILVFIIMRHFYKFINTGDIVAYKTSRIFWVTAGLLVFYLGTLPFFGLRNTLAYHYEDIFWVYYYIQFVLNWMMYSFFCIAFIWGKQK